MLPRRRKVILLRLIKNDQDLNNYSSKILEKAVDELSKLPGIGRKTALRLALHLLRGEREDVELLSDSLLKMRNEIARCRVCHNIADSEICDICNNHKRNRSVVCVVEDIRDVMAIENTSQFNGLYHVLGGIISPMDGIGPGDLTIEQLTARLAGGEITEVILALSATIEGDTTSYYIYKKIKDFDIIVTTIARGVSVGDELEYADEVTLGRSILKRIPYEK